MMSIEQLREQLPTTGNIVIIGFAATGKTTLANRLGLRAKVFHTDDYLQYGHEQSLYVLMDDLFADKHPLRLVEGVLGYRLLRKGAQLGTFSADAVVICECPKDIRYHRISLRAKNVQATFNQDAGLAKIYNDYLELTPAHYLPKIYCYDSESNS